jgi:hypothetical protein
MHNYPFIKSYQIALHWDYLCYIYPSALSCKVGSHFVLISTAHPWEVSYGALIKEAFHL